MARVLRTWTLSALLVLGVFAGLAGGDEAGGGADKLVGSELLHFTLPSQDRLVRYADEFLGRRNVIITFFPAAFTPV